MPTKEYWKFFILFHIVTNKLSLKARMLTSEGEFAENGMMRNALHNPAYIGFRNTLVHDYIDIDIDIDREIVFQVLHGGPADFRALQ